MEAEFKGTKGDWEIMIAEDVNGIKDNKHVVIFSEERSETEKGLFVAICSMSKYENYTEEDEENAHLIKSAPKMLKALQLLIKEYDTKGQILGFDIDIVRRAIKEALNKQ